MNKKGFECINTFPIMFWIVLFGLLIIFIIRESLFFAGLMTGIILMSITTYIRDEFPLIIKVK